MGSSPNFDELSTDKQLAIKELVVLLMFCWKWRRLDSEQSLSKSTINIYLFIWSKF